MVRRVYVEKKKEYAVAAKSLLGEIRQFLQVEGVSGVRIFIRYDVEGVSDETFAIAKNTVFSEPPVDILYREKLPEVPDARVFSVEYLPGQFDQRADSAEQCIRFLNEKETPVVRSATTYMILGKISDADFEKIIADCINPVDSRLTDEEKPETLTAEYPEPEDVPVLDGFCTMPEEEFRALYDSLNLAMTYADFAFIREHFSENEARDPSMTEIRVLDTYWSDHCRHTTFSTELKNISFAEGPMREAIEGTFLEYLKEREKFYKDRPDKYICLMDLATMGARKLKAEGKLSDEEESDEINACSIVVPVDVDGKEEEWLINFKNETHNHPTEIEPFGGAATCLGGAIRDPLSGRTYVYQAMRVTGAADPTAPLESTLPGKLPQKKLVRQAAHGYSSYGNQIGLATGYVKELYHPSYAAKRMEIGAVIAAAPRRAVKRLTSDPGNVIILIGGRTGRDGIGGATGSSKAHNTESTNTCGAEVQKGNAPTERKLQRLFRREEVTRLIRKCNDFGAGGVSVAIGELADGLRIDLDRVPKKYAGLDGTELAISESQERMAVVVDAQDAEAFMAFAGEENLEATEVAVVTEEPRLVMTWRGKEIVNISRAFLNTNGAHQETDVFVEMPSGIASLNDAASENGTSTQPVPSDVADSAGVRAKWLEVLGDLNVCSQKGLVEMFDSSIGAASSLMPYGGRYQLTETQAMAAKVPVPGGKTETVTLMSYGFDPYLSSWSPYHGAAWAVVTSAAKIAAAGGDVSKIRFTFQEYFRRMSEDPTRWSQPFAALLGAYAAQTGLGLPSIGGKDSMSGTFESIDVPPTLVSFAVDTAKVSDLITPELKKAGSTLIRIRMPKDGNLLPDYKAVLLTCEKLREDMKAGRILSAYVCGRAGMAEAVSKMAFGNKIGVRIEHSVDPRAFFEAAYGDFVCEVADGKVGELQSSYDRIGVVTGEKSFSYGNATIDMDEAIAAWGGTLEKVFKTKSTRAAEAVLAPLYRDKAPVVISHKIAQPHVFIPVFPGTNCEYDSRTAFEAAGASVTTSVFRNLTENDIRESVEVFASEIAKAQIIMFPGGFSAGDEPDGSAKFFATAFRNAKIREEVEKLLNERDGLALGICNGFQALIKLGLVPEGRIIGQNEFSPTLTFNTIGRHISKMVYTKVVSNKSPWLYGAELGGVYTMPASHGEGRFVAPRQWLDTLALNGQVATRYSDPNGRVTMDEEWNVNGSFGAIEGITSPDGRVFGKMAHAERRGDGVAINIYGEQDMKIFESGVNYFR